MAIICGTDFSGPAAEAAVAAAAIAMRRRETLHLVHALPGAVFVPEAGSDPSTATPALLERIKARLAAETARLRGLGARVEPELGDPEAPPDEALILAARKHKAGLIVTGHLGRRAPARWLLGSVAEGVARAAPVPALIVHDAKPWTAWSSGKAPLRAAVGVELSEASRSALRWAADLASGGGMELRLFHVFWPQGERERRGLPHPPTYNADYVRIEAALREELAAFVEKACPGARIEETIVRPSLGRIADELVRQAEEGGADLIVVGGHRRSLVGRMWYGSVSQGVLNLSRGTAACVPPPDPGE